VYQPVKDERRRKSVPQELFESTRGKISDQLRLKRNRRAVFKRYANVDQRANSSNK
jgi:hypothetical protein